MLYDYEEGVDSQLAAEMDGLELELNFQHAAAKSDRFSRLLFPRNFPGANSKERLSYLYSITEEVPDTNGGVRITKIPVNEHEPYQKRQQRGITVADALSQEKERAEGLMKEYGGDIHYLPFVGIHYAMWLGDDLLAPPIDYTYDRGDVETGMMEHLEICSGATLPGLEAAIELMTAGAQHFVICKPEWAYGKWGMLPRIPGNATVVFQVKLCYITYELHERFIRMPMKYRAKIPLKAIMATCKRLKTKAKEQFSKASEGIRAVNSNTGEEKIEPSRNQNDYFGAERSGEILAEAIHCLERAVCKNLEDELQLKKYLIYLNCDACLAYKKAKPGHYKKAIGFGEQVLCIFEELLEHYRNDEKRALEFLAQYYPKLNKTRFNLMELYSRDPYNYPADAVSLYGAFEDEICHQNDDDFPYKNYVNKKEKRLMKELMEKIEKSNEEWAERQPRREKDLEKEEDDEEDDPVKAKDDDASKVTRLKAKGLDLEKCIEALEQEDRELRQLHANTPNKYIIPDGGSYKYYKDFVDKFINDKEWVDHPFSHYFTTKCSVQFIVAYANSKGIHVYKGFDPDFNTPKLVISKDFAKSMAKGGSLYSGDPK